ncbi:P-loop containing nucleoside triphosphate hydrolase protein [Cantharellus anzutake]|uniref:P-loop containing nucleoside triphosphate hydrolase protein n=1 Tax=Cantharellus anzutake TaxID=1750568 RepID=UPI0019085CE5|nr:P-loop containing nucleoside triphosphate hydrolase protein [Cantharellus anzutake]KAF8329538.1 P-loop containing nucleoside triphosphate hydrolase protein [Cantharellus anzutake]
MSEDKREDTFSSAFPNILDVRILKALSDLGFARPTLVQKRVIPTALEGRDVLARARTGSGKTAAYCIPVVQKLLQVKSSPHGKLSATRVVILVPTKELSEQVSQFLRGTLKYCEDIATRNVASGGSSQIQTLLLSDAHDIIVGTPSRVLALLQSKSLDLSSLETLVIDEADLVLSFGHDRDVRSILTGNFLPRVFQSFIISATMSQDVEALNGLVLRNPVILQLDEQEDDTKLNQYFIRCAEADKFLIVYVMLVMKLVKGKCIFFVNNLERSYRLKLFLERFSIKGSVLNPDLPVNSRYHAVEGFNRGCINILSPAMRVGTMANSTLTLEMPPSICISGSTDSKRKRKRSTLREDSHQSKRPRQAERKSRRDKEGTEFGVARGVDFVKVACVINFDLPTSSKGYTHRVGRTARGGLSGLAISLIVPGQEFGKNRKAGLTVPSTQYDEEVFARIEKDQAKKGNKISEYQFDMKQVEGFRYRVEDALRTVTREAVRNARVREMENELLNSYKIKTYFKDTGLNVDVIRHDEHLEPSKVQLNLKSVPQYLLPQTASTSRTSASIEIDEPKQDKIEQGGREGSKNKGERKGRGRGKGEVQNRAIL